ncbi:zinc finger protein 701 isoform X3 [Ceratina calcarata]|uniref:Zinc finger protein 701 isoform X3 n=1 Tax=Ceratina calcarata TaxID=156304 RepID=A0AAJ7J3B1_9HYME|nr:zinc finger protein 701 isoform X3 [Ceratina calcarata]
MGLMLSILVGCVGVLELFACLRHVTNGVVIMINQPATPCLSYHEPLNDNMSMHDSICTFSHSSDANLPRTAKHKLENLHEYSLRIRSELRSLDKSFDYKSLSDFGGRNLLPVSRASPDSRLSPDFNYLVQVSESQPEEDDYRNQYERETSYEDAAENWRIESSSRDRPLSVTVPEPDKYIRVPTPIPFSLDYDSSSSGASSQVGTSFDNDSGNEAPTMRSLDAIPVIKRYKSPSEGGSSVDESDYNEQKTLPRKQLRKSRSRTPELRQERAIEVSTEYLKSTENLRSEFGNLDVPEEQGETVQSRSQKKKIKSSSTIVRKPTWLKSKNAEVSKSAENLNARKSKRHREPERRKSDISVQTASSTLRDEWTNTSPAGSTETLSRSDSRKSVSVQVQTSFEEELASLGALTELEGSVASLSESKRDLSPREHFGRRSFKNRRFGSGSRDKADEVGDGDNFSVTNATASVERSKDEVRLLKISSFEEADAEDYRRVRNILTDSDSKELNENRRNGSKSLSSFEDDEYWDAEDLIFSGEYTKAMNKDWHSGHFCCWQCDESLTGQRYVLRDEHPYCIKCYESVFANGCEECNKIIGIDSKDLSYKDKHWHEACFLCNRCRVSLVDKQFGSKVDKIYCGNCYDAQFASRCDGCGEIFRAGTKKMEYKTRQWHEKCFCCCVCKNPIGTKSFIPREQEIYCAGCYEDKFATRCVKCNKIITSGGVTYKNEPWHRDCFTCSNCNNSLAGQRFTSRDDKPYCADCFGELFAKRCTACSKPITGIGGTRFISFEDRHWHNDCFICAGCKTSLVGRGFITDGEDIICPDCAKMKLM